VVITYKGRGCSWALPTCTVTLNHLSHCRSTHIGGDESASYVVLADDTIADILSSIQMSFTLVPKRLILRHV
jgi:hypothetical protein